MRENENIKLYLYHIEIFHFLINSYLILKFNVYIHIKYYLIIK